MDLPSGSTRFWWAARRSVRNYCWGEFIMLSRRALLRGRTAPGSDGRERDAHFFLPWATSRSILSACERCGDCADACPEQIIICGDGGFPTVSFAEGECTFCGDCAAVCKVGVFTPDQAVPWSLKAEIGTHCFTQKGIECRSCQDHCDAKAIRFRYACGAIAEPEISQDLCTGCGACISVCPADCISVFDTEKGRKEGQAS